MKRFARLVIELLRKDVLQFWSLAVLAMILSTVYIVMQGEELSVTSDLIRVVVPFAAFVVAGFLIVSVIHADAPAGIHQEWLTRPIPPAAVIASKTIFIAIATLIPSMLGEAIVALRDHRPLAEVLLLATTFQLWIVCAVLVLCSVAVLTATLIEAAVVIAAVLISTVTLAPLTVWLSGTGEEIYASGAAWLAEEPRVYFAIAVSVALVWLMYRHRSTKRGRALFIACAMLLVASPLLLSWRPVFAAQKWLSAQPRVADQFDLLRDGTCFTSILVDPPLDTDKMGVGVERLWEVMSRRDLTSGLWDTARRREAGSNAIGFETRVLADGLPKNWRAAIERVDGAYLDQSNRQLLKVRPAQITAVWRSMDSGTRAASHFWLLSRQDFNRLAASPVRLSLTYAVSLLQPRAAAELDVDGVRRHIPGIGYCDAEFDAAHSVIKVNCFKQGEQSAQLTANLLSGAADTEIASNFPDYTPAALELLGGRHHNMTLTDVPRVDAARVRLTSYEARAHFERDVVMEGVLGASATACPPPTRAEGYAQ
jgi:hypothetical protein